MADQSSDAIEFSDRSGQSEMRVRRIMMPHANLLPGSRREMRIHRYSAEEEELQVLIA